MLIKVGHQNNDMITDDYQNDYFIGLLSEVNQFIVVRPIDSC